MVKNKLAYSILVLLIITVLPWSYGIPEYEGQIEKITSDLRFYEINTCDISLGHFLLNNINVLYQDHYKININVYSSIKCYGKITGIDQINDVFYISIGANSLINLILISSWFLLILSFLRKTKSIEHDIKKYLISALAGSLIYTFGIYFQPKYYQKTLYLVDFDSFKHFVYLFLIILVINIWSLYLFETRKEKIINFSPYVFLFIGVIQGFNLNFFIMLISNVGVYNFISFIKKFKLFTTYYILLSFLWFYSAYSDLNQYTFKPDKILGLINTSNNSMSVLYWSLLTFLVFAGLYSLCKRTFKYFDLKLITNNFLLTSIFIVTAGLLSANFPIARFYSFLYFGQQKYSTDNRSVFSLDELGVVIPWRGFYPSAESIGEFFSITIFVLIFYIFKEGNKKITLLQSLGLLASLFGLLASNNRSAIFTLFLSIIIFIYLSDFSFIKNFKIYIFVSLFGLLFLFISLLGGFDLFESVNFTKSRIIQTASDYTLDGYVSSSLNYLSNNENFFISFIFAIISTISFYINRSELWGIFVAKYSPSTTELYFGSGPFNFANLYSEIPIKETQSFLLPHSSYIDMLVFFGVINTSIILLILIIFIKRNFQFKRMNLWGYLLLIIFLNLVKSDSILYSSSFLVYTMGIFMSVENSKINKI